MLYLDSTLLMRLKVVPTNGKNATEAGFFLHCGGALRWIESPEYLLFTVSVVSEGLMQDF